MLQNDIEAFLKPYGISHSRFSILIMISRSGDEGMIHSEISRLLGRSKPTITGMLVKLENDALIECQQDQRDLRKKNYRLTNKGQELIASVAEPYNRRLAMMAEALNVEDKQSLITIISKIRFPAQE